MKTLTSLLIFWNLMEMQVRTMFQLKMITTGEDIAKKVIFAQI